jgi:hypothetical protein
MSFEPNDEPPLPESIWNLLRRDEADPRAIRAAYWRFSRRRVEPISALRVLRWLAAGFAAGWGVAFAATGDPLFGAGLMRTRPPPAVVASTSAVPRAVTRPARAPTAPSATPPSESATTDSKPPSPSARAVGSTPQVALPEVTTADAKWQRAAVALKARDYTTAETALRELERGGTPSERDAASLSLAQVLLTRGRTVEARARLERLSVNASSAAVREKATALLAGSFSSGERSSGAPPVPQ